MKRTKQVKTKNMTKDNTKKINKNIKSKRQIGSTKYLQLASFSKKELPPKI